jgi:peroxiredoxin
MRKLIIVMACILAVGIFALRTAQPSLSSPVPLDVGTTAPDFALPEVDAATWAFSGQSSGLVLLSFLDTSYDTDNPSKSQVVFLRSMAKQYPHVRIAAISTADASSLLNLTYDWQMRDTVPLLIDNGGTVTAQYGVRQLPTTYLIRDGRIVQRWDGVALTGLLAIAIETHSS